MTLRKAFRIALATRFLILPFVTFFGSILADMARNLARGGAYDDHETLDPDVDPDAGPDLRYFHEFRFCVPPKPNPDYQGWVMPWDEEHRANE